jgi:hypothetical protein
MLAKTLDATRRLASVGSLQAPYELLWEAFAQTKANPGPDEIGDYLKRFDIANPLPSLAAAMNATQGTLVLSLRSFIQIRNECAHTGTAKIVPTTSDVRSYCRLIEDLGAGIIAVFRNALGSAPYVVQGAPAQLDPPAAPAIPAAQP